MLQREGHPCDKQRIIYAGCVPAPALHRLQAQPVSRTFKAWLLALQGFSRPAPCQHCRMPLWQPVASQAVSMWLWSLLTARLDWEALSWHQSTREHWGCMDTTSRCSCECWLPLPCCSRQLENHQTLEACKIERDSTLHLMLRMVGD